MAAMQCFSASKVLGNFVGKLYGSFVRMLCRVHLSYWHPTEHPRLSSWSTSTVPFSMYDYCLYWIYCLQRFCYTRFETPRNQNYKGLVVCMVLLRVLWFHYCQRLLPSSLHQTSWPLPHLQFQDRGNEWSLRILKVSKVFHKSWQVYSSVRPKTINKAHFHHVISGIMCVELASETRQCSELNADMFASAGTTTPKVRSIGITSYVLISKVVPPLLALLG